MQTPTHRTPFLVTPPQQPIQATNSLNRRGEKLIFELYYVVKISALMLLIVQFKGSQAWGDVFVVVQPVLLIRDVLSRIRMFPSRITDSNVLNPGSLFFPSWIPDPGSAINNFKYFKF
jgi:hypothetical protein